MISLIWCTLIDITKWCTLKRTSVLFEQRCYELVARYACMHACVVYVYYACVCVCVCILCLCVCMYVWVYCIFMIWTCMGTWHMCILFAITRMPRIVDLWCEHICVHILCIYDINICVYMAVLQCIIISIIFYMYIRLQWKGCLH